MKTVVDNLTQLEIEMLSNVFKSDIDANSAKDRIIFGNPQHKTYC